MTTLYDYDPGSWNTFHDEASWLDADEHPDDVAARRYREELSERLHGERPRVPASRRSSTPAPREAPPSPAARPSQRPREAGGQTTAADVVALVRRDYELGRSTEGLTFAVPRYPGALRVAREIRSLRGEVTRRLHETTGAVPGRETVSGALETAAAYAEQASPVPVSLRSAQVGTGRVVVDLGDADGRVIEVTAAGWTVKVADATTPLFRRSSALAPLPVPQHGGSSDELRELLGLDAEDARWRVVRGWLATLLLSAIPRPMLWVTGPQGSGKSTRARMILGLVEPVESLGREPGRNERDDNTSALGRFVPSWDNITTVNQVTSDWLCRLVTGVTVDRRALYSDDDLRPVSFRRAGVATSLTLPNGLGSDALERLALVELQRVSDGSRRGERGLWDAWREAHPRMLGAVLDDLVCVLFHLDAVQAEGRAWPRMADHAQALLALDHALGLPDDAGHLAAYVSGVDTSLAGRAEDDPFAGAVIELLRQRGGAYDGPSEGLLCALAPHAPTGRDAWWPTNARGLSTALTRASEELRHAGVTVENRRTSRARLLRLVLTEAE